MSPLPTGLEKETQIPREVWCKILGLLHYVFECVNINVLQSYRRFLFDERGVGHLALAHLEVLLCIHLGQVANRLVQLITCFNIHALFYFHSCLHHLVMNF